MPRYVSIAKALQTRIQHGDYRMQAFPTVSKLAVELGVNPRTVVKAMDELERMGVLERLQTGRFTVRATAEQKSLHVAFLVHAYPSRPMQHLYDQFTVAVAGRGWKIRLVSYAHWRDPIVASSLRGFDACVFVPTSGAGEHKVLPDHVGEEIRSCEKPVMVASADASDIGIPSFRSTGATGIAPLLDLFLPARHDAVACLNTQPHGGLTNERIDQWSFWTRLHGKRAPLIDQPVETGKSAIDQAHAVMSKALSGGRFNATALFCTTGATAIGAMRAMEDHGIEPGRQIAVSAADSEGGLATMLRPSLTCVKPFEITPYLNVFLDWFASGKPWSGPLLVQPPEISVFVGESTSRFTQNASE